MKNLLTLLLISLSTFSQAQFRFQHLYGGVNNERGQTLLETFNNKYIFNGATTSYGQGSADAILIKNDNDGQIIWSKVYGTSEYDNSEYVVEATDYGYVGVGRSIVNNGSTTHDAWIFKTDSAGTLQWSKTFGSPGVNDAFIHAINTSDNGYTFIGNTRSLGQGSDDVFMVHTDSNGDTVFTRTFGSPESESGLSVFQTADDGYVICGRQQTFPNGLAESDGLIIRTDVNGDLLWANLYGDTMWEEFESIEELPNGRLILAGSTVSFGEGNYDILMMMTDEMGVPINAYSYGGEKGDASYSINVNPDYTFTISGYTDNFGHGHSLMGDDSTNIFLLKTDTTGAVLWMVAYGDGLQDEAFRSAKSSDGGYLISGFTVSYTPQDSTQMLFIKTDSAGLTGCHEELVAPATSSDTMDYRASGFIQSSGITVTSLSITETSITTVNNDACLFAEIEKGNLANEDLISVYPVPFTTEINIDTENLKGNSFNVQLINSSGQIVLSETYSSGIKIKTTELSAGFYCVVVSGIEDRVVKRMLKVADN